MTAPDDVATTLGLHPDGRPRRRWGRWAALAAGGAAVIGVGAWWATREAPGPAWETGVVERGDLAVEVTAVGTLEPLHAVDVGSTVSGTVAAVLVDTNDRVKAGQPLARLDTELLAAQAREAAAALAATEASVRRARVEAEAATRDLGSAQRLHAGGSLATAELDQARLAHDRADAALALALAQRDQARAARDAAESNLARAVIVSPIDGVVLARNVDPGQAVVSSLQVQTLFRVAEDLARMSVDVAVDEADIGRVKEGQRATFTVSAHADRVFDAVVHQVDLAPQSAAAVVTYLACLHLENPDGLLRPGMTATAEIESERLVDRLLVPTAALRFEPPGTDLPTPAERDGKRVGRVWVLDGGEPRPVEVVTSASDGRRAVVEAGDIGVGDTVLTGLATPAAPGAGPR